MKVKRIKTTLVAREEVFRILALGEALRIPVLLEGPPGTGKSHSLYDYSDNGREDVFLTELDTGSKASEVKGFLDMKALLEEKTYRTFSPIAEKKFILINEVEKGSPEIRNTLLSIMQEKQLQLGSEGVKDCKWEVFAGSCNSIPADERKEPFWDRFLVKTSVASLTPDQMRHARRRVAHEVVINIPEEDKGEIPMVSQTLLNKFDELTVKDLSDRARINVPRLAGAVKYIWGIDDYQALCKVAAFLCPEKVTTISSSLIPKEINEMKTLIHNIETQQDQDAKFQMFAKLQTLVSAYDKSKDKDKEMISMVKQDLIRITDIIEKEFTAKMAKTKSEASSETTK